MTDERDRNTLRRIAHALGIAVEDFSTQCAGSDLMEVLAEQLEVNELLRAFANIMDAQVRHECIEYVRARQAKSSL